MGNEINDFKSVNNELEEYINFFEKEEGFVYKGKDIFEIKNK